MTTTVCVNTASDGRYIVACDGARIASALDDFDQALKITSLVIRAELGDPDSDDAAEAAAELDRLGVEPPTLEPDPTPLPHAA